MITILHRGGGSLGTPKSDYVICARPLIAYTNLFTHESVYSSPSLLNEYLWYDKLWGTSQRVVTLFSTEIMEK